MFEEYRDRVGELITGIVQQSDSRYTLVQLRERVEALLPQVRAGRRRALRPRPARQGRHQGGLALDQGPVDHRLSRRDPELIKSLFELEVPEIADGLVEIANVAREPGYRSKIAVVSYADGVDPVGACVGPRGSRVRMVVSELRGEKIDIIPYNDEPARFVAKALSPARVREVLVDDDARQATVIVPDDQLSLAIGREGQNARLAARLTGWRIDIRSETEFATEEPEHVVRRGGDRRALRGDPGQRPPLPERRAARLALTAASPAHQALRGHRQPSTSPASLRRSSRADDGDGRGGRRRGGARRGRRRGGRRRPRRGGRGRGGRGGRGAAEEVAADGRAPSRPPRPPSPRPSPPTSRRGRRPPPTDERRRGAAPHSGARHTSRSDAASACGRRAPQAALRRLAVRRRPRRRGPAARRCPGAAPTSATRPARRRPSSAARCRRAFRRAVSVDR